MLAAIWMARIINAQAGGAVVAPWDVGELPGDWLDALMGMAVEMPAMATGKQQVENALDRWRQRNKDYA